MLKFEFTDRGGQVLGHVDKHYGGEVVIPINDSRTAKVTLDLWDPACALVPQRPVDLGKIMLKVFYDEYFVFWGIVTSPSWDDEEENRVVVYAIDPTLALMKRMIGIDDQAYKTGHPFDGTGMWALILQAEPSTAQINAGALKTGIVKGVDTTTPKTTKFKSQRGAVIYDEIQSRQEIANGPDWNLRPIDALHPGVTATWVPGVYAEFSTYAKRGVDRRATLPFHDGWGRTNCRVGYTPDFTKEINYSVVTASGGPTDDTSTGSGDVADTRALTQLPARWAEVGIMEDWSSTQATTTNLSDLKEGLQSQADAIVSAYGTSPPFFKITLPPQGAVGPQGFTADEPLRYLTHFTEGDQIRGQKRKGFTDVTVDGRIGSVTLTDDERGQTTTTLDCVPTVGGNS